ncbi:MAG: sodium:solute symporter family protein [Bacteroidota bacterium]|nr:sodium:solute symporter family protein [Bacteroidota bacterium]
MGTYTVARYQHSPTIYGIPMNSTLHPLDLAIIIGYVIGTIILGFVISKRAARSLQSYFLADNSLDWKYLGLSNASGMFDISGTMWTVSIAFIYGLKSAWIPWLWPVWNQVFVMIFLAVWMRRSGVMTGAEWITFRFGTGRGAQLSHIIVVIFALVTVIGFIAYGFEGVGKFAAVFLPWDLSFHALGRSFTNDEGYALLIMALTTLYCIKGGMYSVVLTEMMQFILMTLACLVVGIIAMIHVRPELLNAHIPAGWKDLWFGWTINLDWSSILPAVNDRIKTDGFEMFGWAMMLMIFKGILASIAGPVPSYDMQRVLATRSPSDAAKMSGFTILVLYMPRYFMVAGLTALALVFFSDEIAAMGSNIDFELVLPLAIRNFIPVGWRGILLAGLIAAFMSTFAAFVNAAPAYLVNDIYKRYINPDTSDRTSVRLSYISSIVLVLIGIVFGFFVESIDTITKWIVASLYGGYTASNALKWLWWRFNGYGYFWGMIAGLAGSMTIPKLFPELSSLNAFPIIFAIALSGSLLGTLLTAPEDDATLMEFYRRVRPWGFWKPIIAKIQAEDASFQGNTSFWHDMLNCALGITWQMTQVILPMYLVFGMWSEMAVTLAVFSLCTWLLKRWWWDRLE